MSASDTHKELKDLSRFLAFCARPPKEAPKVIQGGPLESALQALPLWQAIRASRFLPVLLLFEQDLWAMLIVANVRQIGPINRLLPCNCCALA